MLKKDAFNSEYFNSFEYRETYNSGDDSIFEKYVKRVQSGKLQKILRNVRNLLKSNVDQFFFSALEFLENKVIKEYLSGRLEISNTFDWEMIGRAFETIVDRFLENVSIKAKNSFNIAKDHAMLCFKNAGNKNRLKRLYEMFNIGDTDTLRRQNILEDLEYSKPGESGEFEVLDYQAPGKNIKEDWEEDWGERKRPSQRNEELKDNNYEEGETPSQRNEELKNNWWDTNSNELEL